MSYTLTSWQQQGEIIPVFNNSLNVFCLSMGSTDAPPEKTALLVHGFPESSYSFYKVVDGLLKQFDRIILLDMPGYGFSDKPVTGYSYSLLDQASVVVEVWQHFGATGGHIICHDMGTSVTTEILARFNDGELPDGFNIHSLTFTNGSMVLQYAKLRITQKLLLTSLGNLMTRLTNYWLFQNQVRSAHGTGDMPEADIEGLWKNVTNKNGHRINHLLIQYHNERLRHETNRWLPAVANAKVPIHICWGTADAVASIEIARHVKREVNPDVTLTEMEGVGHFCQLASPDVWLENILKFY